MIGIRFGVLGRTVSDKEALCQLGLSLQKGLDFARPPRVEMEGTTVNRCKVSVESSSIVRLCENSLGSLRLGSGRTVKCLVLLTPQPRRGETLEP
jgi:hypothetical protein